METETSQRQRGVVRATLRRTRRRKTSAARRKGPEMHRLLSKCETLLEVCYQYKSTLSSFENAYKYKKYLVRFSVCFVFKACCCKDGRWCEEAPPQEAATRQAATQFARLASQHPRTEAAPCQRARSVPSSPASRIGSSLARSTTVPA